MESIDMRLRAEGEDIAFRPMEALRLVSLDKNIDIPWGEPLATKINAWFEERYGERLKVDLSIGRMLLLIRGDAYVLKCPLAFDAQVSLLRLIEGVTASTLRSLAPDELTAMRDAVQRACDVFAMLHAGHVPRELLADWDAAVAQAVARPPHTGLSKWSSQQVVEKLLNGFIEKNGGDPKKVCEAAKRAAQKHGKKTQQHSLWPLVHDAEARGLATLDREHLSRVECTANVRYAGRDEARAVTVAAAVEANQSSVFLAGAIAQQW
jgi:hypothetical protein